MMFDKSSFQLTKPQALLILSFMERNTDLATGKIDDPAKEKALWTELAANLNAIGGEKTPKTWKEVWQQFVQNTRDKNVNTTDLRIMNIFFDNQLLGDVTARERAAERFNQAAASNPEELYVVEENQMKIHNRVLTHMLREMIAHTRVVGVCFNTLNGNVKKVYKAIKKEKWKLG